MAPRDTKFSIFLLIKFRLYRYKNYLRYQFPQIGVHIGVSAKRYKVGYNHLLEAHDTPIDASL
eukprot:SAG11_NODE_25357_length_359_cov_418.776923_1_plen_62_part_10